MGSRRISRNIPPSYEERIRQESEMMHRGHTYQHHPVEQLPSPELFDGKLAAQAAELEQLTRDNHKLAAGQLSLREEHAAVVGEVNKMNEHIRSIRTKGDIEIRILLDKIAKSEADIRAGDKLKRELQEAHIEERSVMTSKLELTAKFEQAINELEHSGANINKLPDMRANLESLKEEYQKLRNTFEYEKSLNVEKVERMKALENDLIGIAGEVQRLRTEVSNAEKRANVPIPYGNLPPPPFRGNGGGYFDSFGGPHLHTVHGAPMQLMNPYARGGFAVGPPQVISGSAGGADGGFAVGPQVMSGTVGDIGGGSAWGGVYDTSHNQV